MYEMPHRSTAKYKQSYHNVARPGPDLGALSGNETKDIRMASNGPGSRFPSQREGGLLYIGLSRIKAYRIDSLIRRARMKTRTLRDSPARKGKVLWTY